MRVYPITVAETPTRRTLKRLRELGYLADVWERRVPNMAAGLCGGCKRPKLSRLLDGFGIVDVVAVREGEMLLVQCTSSSNQASRVSKALSTGALPMLLSVLGVRFEVWGWKKYARRVERRAWRETRQEIRLGDFNRLEPSDVPF